jgi:hypothetical protein
MTNICETCKCSFPVKYPDKKRPQKFCSLSCAGKRPRYTIRKRVIRQCVCCNITFKVLKSDPKQFCSRTCAAKINNSRRKHIVTCATCGTDISGKNKKYCSVQCSTSALTAAVIADWKNGTLKTKHNQLPKTVRRWLIQERNSKCEICGWNNIHPITQITPLQIHHIDGNSTNNNIENLQVLCPNCHALTPTYGGLNRGNGRSYRYSNLVISDGLEPSPSLSANSRFVAVCDILFHHGSINGTGTES